MWNLLFSGRHLVPTRTGKCTANEILKRQPSWSIRSWGRNQERSCRDYRGWFESVVWIEFQFFSASAVGVPFLSWRTTLGCIPLHLMSVSLFSVSNFKWGSKVEHSYPVQIRSKKSQTRGPTTHTNAGHPDILTSSPPAITSVKWTGNGSLGVKLCHPEESFRMCYHLRCNFPKGEGDKVIDSVFLIHLPPT